MKILQLIKFEYYLFIIQKYLGDKVNPGLSVSGSDHIRSANGPSVNKIFLSKLN